MNPEKGLSGDCEIPVRESLRRDVVDRRFPADCGNVRAMDGKRWFTSRVVCKVSSSSSSRGCAVKKKKNDEDEEKEPEAPCPSRDELHWRDHEPCA